MIHRSTRAAIRRRCQPGASPGRRHIRDALRSLALGALATTGLAGGLWLAACGATSRGPQFLLPSPTTAPPDIQQACQLTTLRCSHCHPIDRLTVAHGIGMHRWEMFVDEMRLKPSSGISIADAQIVLRCLRYIEEPQAAPAPAPAAPSAPSSEPAAPGAPAEPEIDTKQGRS